MYSDVTVIHYHLMHGVNYLLYDNWTRGSKIIKPDNSFNNNKIAEL